MKIPIFFTCTACGFSTMSQLVLNKKLSSSLYDTDEFCFDNSLFEIQCSICEKTITSTRLLGIYRRHLERKFPMLLDEYFLDSILEEICANVKEYIDAQTETERKARSHISVLNKCRKERDACKRACDNNTNTTVVESTTYTTNINTMFRDRVEEEKLEASERYLKSLEKKDLSRFYRINLYEKTVEIDLSEHGLNNHLTKTMANYNTLHNYLRYNILARKYYLFNDYILPPEDVCKRFEKFMVCNKCSSSSKKSDDETLICVCDPLCVELPQLVSVHVKRNRFHYMLKLKNDGRNHKRLRNFQHRFWKCNSCYESTSNNMCSARIWMLEKYKNGYKEVTDWEKHDGAVWISFSKFKDYPKISEGVQLDPIIIKIF